MATNTGKSVIPIDPESKPLTARQKEVVDHILSTGQSPYEAEDALGMAATNIYRILRMSNVKRYIADATRERIGLLAPIAARVQGELLHSDSDHVRAAMSESILNRTLGKAVERRQVAVSGGLHVKIDLSGSHDP